MKKRFILLILVILIIIGCSKEQPKPIEKTPSTIEPAEKQPEQECTESWVCLNDNTLAYRRSDCDFEQVEDCPQGCENNKCKKVVIPEEPKREEPQPNNETILGEEILIQEIFDYSKKITSYSYKYKDPAGPQYNIYVKGNKIKIDYISETKQIYLDTDKKTAEEYCISHSKCGRQTGKIADLDYSKAYIQTPIDWLAKITKAKKIDEGVYYGKNAWKLDTNIGEVVIDSNFGFIYSIKEGDKTYSFSEATFNTVKDSDVNIPEYLIPK